MLSWTPASSSRPSKLVMHSVVTSLLPCSWPCAAIAPLDPSSLQAECLLPSVRCGLETALLSALAAAARPPLWALLAAPALPSASAAHQTSRARSVLVCGLLDGTGTAADAAAEAVQLVQAQKFTTLKLKVRQQQARTTHCLYGASLSAPASAFGHVWRHLALFSAIPILPCS